MLFGRKIENPRYFCICWLPQVWLPSFNLLLLTSLLIILEHDRKSILELFRYSSTHNPNRIDGVGKGLHLALKQIATFERDVVGHYERIPFGVKFS